MSIIKPPAAPPTVPVECDGGGGAGKEALAGAWKFH